MPPADDGYRDALPAAQSRMAELERTVAAQQGITTRAATVAALRRERARVAAPVDSSDLVRAVWRVGITCAIASLGFAINGTWPLAAGVLAIPVVVWFAGTAMLRASASANAKQLALIDAELAKLGE